MNAPASPAAIKHSGHCTPQMSCDACVNRAIGNMMGGQLIADHQPTELPMLDD